MVSRFTSHLLVLCSLFVALVWMTAACDHSYVFSSHVVTVCEGDKDDEGESCDTLPESDTADGDDAVSGEIDFVEEDAGDTDGTELPERETGVCTTEEIQVVWMVWENDEWKTIQRCVLPEPDITECPPPADPNFESYLVCWEGTGCWCWDTAMAVSGSCPNGTTPLWLDTDTSEMKEAVAFCHFEWPAPPREGQDDRFTCQQVEDANYAAAQDPTPRCRWITKIGTGPMGTPFICVGINHPSDTMHGWYVIAPRESTFEVYRGMCTTRTMIMSMRR